MTTAENIVAELDRLYTASVTRLQDALTLYLTQGTPPDPARRKDGSFAYPEIRVSYRNEVDRPTPARSFGRPSVAPNLNGGGAQGEPRRRLHCERGRCPARCQGRRRIAAP